MKFGTAYHGSISLTPEEREKAGLPEKKPDVSPNPTSPAEQAATAQEKFDWLASPATAAMLKGLAEEAEQSLEEAIKLAVGYSSHRDPFRIIQLLNKAYELRNLIKRYGK